MGTMRFHSPFPSIDLFFYTGETWGHIAVARFAAGR